MIIDYYEADQDGNTLVVHAGVQFEDEPDSLYVAELAIAGGVVQRWTLYFNGFDCAYTFKPAEQEQLCAYLTAQGVSVRMPE